MSERKITRDRMELFSDYLRREERSVGTIDKYLRDVRQFASWLNGKAVTKETAAAWKEELLRSGCSPVTVNSKRAAWVSFSAASSAGRTV